MKAVPRVSRPYQAFSVLGLVSLCSLACTGSVGGMGPDAGPGGSGQTGGSANAGGAVGTGGSGTPADLSRGGPKLRVLTQTEYKNALTYLLGPISTPLELPADL